VVGHRKWVSRDGQLFKDPSSGYVIAEIERLGPVAHRGRPELFSIIESTRERRAWDRRNRHLVRTLVPFPAWTLS